jgi:hypothetical protein
MTTTQAKAIEAQGAQAYRNGQSDSANPYVGKDDEKSCCWYDGWEREARKDR